MGPDEIIFLVFIMVFLWIFGTDRHLLGELDHFLAMPTVKSPKYQIESVLPYFSKF